MRGMNEMDARIHPSFPYPPFPFSLSSSPLGILPFLTVAGLIIWSITLLWMLLLLFLLLSLRRKQGHGSRSSHTHTHTFFLSLIFSSNSWVYALFSYHLLFHLSHHSSQSSVGEKDLRLFSSLPLSPRISSCFW